MKKLITAIILSAVCAFAIADPFNFSYKVPFPSAVQTGVTLNSPTYSNPGLRGGYFVVNISAYTSGSYTVRLQGQDPISLVYYDVLVSPVLNSTGTTILKIYPGITAITNGATSDLLPSLWRIQLNGATTPSMTLSVSAVLEQ